MAVDRGAEAVARDPKGFARLQWETWSPPGWFDEAEFEMEFCGRLGGEGFPEFGLGAGRIILLNVDSGDQIAGIDVRRIELD